MAYRGIPEFLLSAEADIARLKRYQDSLHILYSQNALEEFEWGFAANSVENGELKSSLFVDKVAISCATFGGLKLYFPVGSIQQDILRAYGRNGVDWRTFEQLKQLSAASLKRLSTYVSLSNEKQQAFVCTIEGIIDLEFTDSLFYEEFQEWEEVVIEQEVLQDSVSHKQSKKTTMKI